MRRLLCSALVAVATGTSASALWAAQGVPTTLPQTRLARYVDDVSAHGAGANDDAIRRLRMESATRVRSRIAELAEIQQVSLIQGLAPTTQLRLERLPSGTEPPGGRFYSAVPMADAASILRLEWTELLRGGVGDVIARAVLFHTDAVAIAVEGQDDEIVVEHFEHARSLAELLERDPARRYTARAWALAIGALLSLRYPRQAKSAFALGSEWFPNDAALHLAMGELAETQASPRVQEAALAGPRVAASGALGRRRSTLQPAGNYLGSAAAEYRRALARDSGLAEARLRLGRVLSQLGQFSDAWAELLATPAPTDDTFLAYHRHMFLGNLGELRGDPRAAETHYRAALTCVSSGHAARVALSHLLEARGDLSEARDLLAAHESGRDPWLDYQAGPRLARDYMRAFYTFATMRGGKR
jgi:tetratricopeptide (TPR) repeat protein